jgi:DNA-binding MarR family transcriptional regulator
VEHTIKDGTGAVSNSEADLTGAEYRALGGFRYQIRRFLHFSEQAARVEGLEPQQHQLMLAIRVLDGPDGPTMGELAQYLLVRHHSAVELVDRLAKRRLVERVRGQGDGRLVRIRLTAEGRDKLKWLSSAHRAELCRSGPLLVEALRALLGPRPAEEEDVFEGQE